MSRCIDADALEPDADYYEGDYWAVSIVQIHNAPTIEPRKKGKWITKSTNGEMFDCCSACGYVEWDVPKNFCPNCGADMREPEDIPMEYFESGGR